MSSTANLASFQAGFGSPVYGGGMFATSYHTGTTTNGTLYLPLYNQIGTIYITAKDSGGVSYCQGTFLTNANVNYLSYDTTSSSSGNTQTGVGFINVNLINSVNPIQGKIYCWVNKSSITGNSYGNYGVQFTYNFANTSIEYISVVYIGTAVASELTTTNPNTN